MKDQGYLKLFAVEDRSTGELIAAEGDEPTYFNNKRLAKHFRDSANYAFPNRDCRVVLGPDHRRYRRNEARV